MDTYNQIMALTADARAELLAGITTYSDYELHIAYDHMLDDCCEPVMIAGHEYATSDALKSVDPVAYRCGFNDWIDTSEDYYTEIAGIVYDTSELENALNNLGNVNND